MSLFIEFNEMLIVGVSKSMSSDVHIEKARLDEERDARLRLRMYEVMKTFCPKLSLLRISPLYHCPDYI
jgi:hypothetical protein